MSAIDRKADLLRFRQPFFRVKLERSREVIARALAVMRAPYVGFSGGKDSLACLALVLEQKPDITVNWSDDELEHDETVKYNQRMAREWGFNLLVTLGWATHAGWFLPWRERPYFREPLPGAVYAGEMLQTFMPKRGYDGVFLGLRKAEAGYRRQYLDAKGRLHRCVDGAWRCNPLAGWTTDEVWALIAGLNLPYNPVYDVLARIGVTREEQRVGPLPLSPAWHLQHGWPDLFRRLVERYGDHWSGARVEDVTRR